MDVSTNTRVIVGWDFTFESKQKDFQKALKYCEYEIAKISKTLRLGSFDVSKFKELLKKLPPAKQKPLIDTFKRLTSINKLREQVMAKLDSAYIEAEELSKKSAIIIRDQLFSRVFIQVGESRLKTEQDLEKLKIRMKSDGKEIEMLSLKP